MDIKVGIRDGSTGFIAPYARIFSYDDEDYALVKEHLLQVVKTDNVSEDETGLTLTNEYLDSDEQSLATFKKTCKTYLMCVNIYGIESEEIAAVSDLLLAQKNDDTDVACNILLPTERRGYKIARDVHGCFLGVCTKYEAARMWRNTSFIDGVISVPQTVELDKAATLINLMTLFPYYRNVNRASRSVVDAYKNRCIIDSMDNAEEYWQSQLDVAWDVFYRDDEPFCTMPYSVILCTLGRGWFCIKPHAVQVIPHKSVETILEEAVELAEQRYEVIAPAGELCVRKTGEMYDASLICVESKVVTEADGYASVVDSKGRLLAIRKPRSLINSFGVLVSVNGGYETFDSGKRRHPLSDKKLLSCLDQCTKSPLHIKKILKALGRDNKIISVYTEDNKLVGYFKEAYVRGKWKVIKVEYYNHYCDPDYIDDYIIIENITEKERLNQLNHCLMNTRALSTRDQLVVRDEIRELSRSIARLSQAPMKQEDIATIVGVATDYLIDRHNIDVQNKAANLLDRYLKNKRPNVIAARVTRVLAEEGSTSVALDGEELAPKDLVARAWEGNKGAIELVADIAARGIERSESSQTESESKHAVDDDIPEWARPQRAYIIEWAERTIAAEKQLRDQPATLYVASQIKAGKADVLVFDCPLYQEVVAADMEGRLEYDAASWPYPVSIIRLVGVEGVHGVAVCRVSDVNRYARKRGLAQLAESGGLCSFFIGDATGAVEAGPGARAEADRLITYLDCDNANVDTIYVDGGPRQYQQSGGQAPPQDDVEYRVGADYVTGDRIVVERDREHGAMHQVRKAHFRRGFYRRSRIGPRDKWHYEVRWVKPTFVHGAAKQSVTEHKVTRIVLRPIDVEKDDK